MSVIAKMQLDGTLDFPNGSKSKLSCVCENDLMAAYADSEEDRLFTKYSPWGEMEIEHGFKDPKTGMKQFADGHRFYVIAVRNERVDGALKIERPAFPGAAHVHPAHCPVVHDFGTDKQIELVNNGWGYGGGRPKPDEHPGLLHWRMTVDNPPAVEFFEPGGYGYWVAFYDAETFTRDTALADAFRVSE